jgi:lipoprotein-anchoring transpeptidase ErfK/SrfK
MVAARGGVKRSFLYRKYNDPDEIGDTVSQMCVRIRNEDVDGLFAKAYAGEWVDIVERPVGFKATD